VHLTMDLVRNRGDLTVEIQENAGWLIG